jgi:hypothetical protein
MNVADPKPSHRNYAMNDMLGDRRAVVETLAPVNQPAFLAPFSSDGVVLR